VGNTGREVSSGQHSKANIVLTASAFREEAKLSLIPGSELCMFNLLFFLVIGTYLSFQTLRAEQAGTQYYSK
jgi:hypothetical protein